MGELSNIKNQALAERIEERLYQYILKEKLPIGTKLLPRTQSRPQTLKRKKPPPLRRRNPLRASRLTLRAMPHK